MYSLIVFGPVDIVQFDNVGMPPKFLQEHDLPEGALRVSGIPECIEYLFKGNYVSGAAVGGFPYNAIGALSQPFMNLVSLANVRVDIFGHCTAQMLIV